MKNFIICKATKEDVNALKQLWVDCFEEKETAVNLFFNKMFDKLNVYCVKDNNKIISALYLVKATLNNEKSHYLCGACTLNSYRKQGIMTKLINYAIEKEKSENVVYSLLFPANKNLYNYYKKFGYQNKCKATILNFSREELKDNLLVQKYNLCANSGINELEFYKDYYDFSKLYYEQYGLKVINQADVFILFEETNDSVNVQYIKANSFINAKNILLNTTKADKFSFVVNGALQQTDIAKTIDYGMILSLDKFKKIPNNSFIGITLN